MPTIILPTSLEERAEGRRRIEVRGATVGECLVALEFHHPRLRGWILDDQGLVRTHVNVFVNEAIVTLERSVGRDDEIFVIQAISGGDRHGK